MPALFSDAIRMGNDDLSFGCEANPGKLKRRSSMKKQFVAGCACLIFFSLLLFASSALGATYFSKDGRRIDSGQYDQALSAYKPLISKIAEEGYAEVVVGFEDPVVLRKKRIEQWKQWRKSRRGRMN